MNKLRTWWTQLWCKHHWHYLWSDLVGWPTPVMTWDWECCWCTKPRRTYGVRPDDLRDTCFMGRGKGDREPAGE